MTSRRPGARRTVAAALALTGAVAGTAQAVPAATAGTAATAATTGTGADAAFAAAAADRGTAPTVAGLPALVLDAHRAGGLEARENSLSGIKRALASGVVDVIDLDVRRLEDGALGVMHDATVDRVTTSPGATSSYTRAEWRGLVLDIGAWLRPVPPPEAPPTLAKVLRRFGDETVFTVEVKEGLLDEVARLLRARGLTDSVLVNTNAPDVARAVHALGLRAHLWRSRAQMQKDDPTAWARWLDVVDVDVRAERADLERFVASGVPRVWAHTVTTRAERDRAVRLGLGGIVTDDPRYVSGRTDRFPASPTLLAVPEPPREVQVSDRTTARVMVSNQSGPVNPEARVTVDARSLSGRTVERPWPGANTVEVSAAEAETGRHRVTFVVAAGRGKERRWPRGETAVRVRVLGEDLQLVPSTVTHGDQLAVTVRLLDSAARDYDGPGAERGTGARSVAALPGATVRLRVFRDGRVVHRQRATGVDTGKPGDGDGTLRFTTWHAPRAGRYTVRLVQRGPVYRRVVVERTVRLD